LVPARTGHRAVFVSIERWRKQFCELLVEPPEVHLARMTGKAAGFRYSAADSGGLLTKAAARFMGSATARHSRSVR
jgi:hypothetical protein